MKKRFSEEQIIKLLQRAEKLRDEGKTVAELSKILEIGEQTYYSWRKKYHGMTKPEVQKLRKLEKENQLLKKLLAEKEMDISILKVALEGN